MFVTGNRTHTRINTTKRAADALYGQSLSRRRTWYAPDGDPGSTGDDAGNNGGTTGNPPGQNGGNPPPPQTFKQEDVDRIVGERAQRAKEAALADALKALGVDKLEDAKALIENQRKADEANKSELQKAQDRAAALEKERDDMKAAVEAEKQARIMERRNSAIVTAAVAAGAVNGDDVVLWAQSNASELLTKAVKDGQPDAAGIKALVDEAKKQRAHWFKQNRTTPGIPSNAGGGTPDPDKKDRDAVLANQVRRTRQAFG